MIMKKELETLYFYTANDYLIVNNLLLNKLSHLEKMMEVVNNDYKGMIEEMKDNPQKRLGCEKELAEEIFECYKARFQERIDKQKTIKRAKQDIENLTKLAEESEESLILFRNIKSTHLEDFLGKQTYESKGFSSCLKVPTDTIYSFGPKDKFLQLELTIPKGFKLIETDKLPKFCQNEEGEIILTPFLADITKIEKTQNEKCEAKICLTLKKPLEAKIHEL